MKVHTITGKSLADVEAKLSAWLAAHDVTTIAVAYVVVPTGRELLVVYHEGAPLDTTRPARKWIGQQLEEQAS